MTKNMHSFIKRSLFTACFVFSLTTFKVAAQNPANGGGTSTPTGQDTKVKSEKPAKSEANPKNNGKGGATNRIEVSDHVQPHEKTPVRKAINKDKAVQPKK